MPSKCPFIGILVTRVIFWNNSKIVPYILEETWGTFLYIQIILKVFYIPNIFFLIFHLYKGFQKAYMFFYDKPIKISIFLKNTLGGHS